MADVRNISIRSNPLDEIMIDGDETRIIRLDLNDIGVFSRFDAALPALEKVEEHFRALNESADDDVKNMQNYSRAMAAAEADLTDIIDGIFNAKVCAVCAGGCSLFALDNGEFLYERIVAAVAGLYGDRLKNQVAARKKRMSKHTAKYGK